MSLRLITLVTQAENHPSNTRWVWVCAFGRDAQGNPMDRSMAMGLPDVAWPLREVLIEEDERRFLDLRHNRGSIITHRTTVAITKEEYDAFDPQDLGTHQRWKAEKLQQPS